MCEKVDAQESGRRLAAAPGTSLKGAATLAEKKVNVSGVLFPHLKRRDRKPDHLHSLQEDYEQESNMN